MRVSRVPGCSSSWSSCAAAVVLVGYGWVEAGWLRTRVLEVTLDGLPDGPRRRADRTPIRLPPRRAALAREPCERTGRAVGRRAPTRPRLYHGRPRLPSSRRAAPRGPPGRPRASLRRARQSRRRSHTRSVLDGPRSFAISSTRDFSGTRQRSSFCAGNASRWLEWIRRPIERSRPGRTSWLIRRRRFVCFSAISRESSNGFRRSSFDLILTGHLHAGQICLPLPGRRVTLAHPRAEFVSGLYGTKAGRMHVSPGTGTTFVPLRFFARPEATELVLRRGTRLCPASSALGSIPRLQDGRSSAR